VVAIPPPQHSRNWELWAGYGSKLSISHKNWSVFWIKCQLRSGKNLQIDYTFYVDLLDLGQKEMSSYHFKIKTIVFNICFSMQLSNSFSLIFCCKRYRPWVLIHNRKKATVQYSGAVIQNIADPYQQQRCTTNISLSPLYSSQILNISLWQNWQRCIAVFQICQGWPWSTGTVQLLKG
jgi:hypothetical protein